MGETPLLDPVQSLPQSTADEDLLPFADDTPTKTVPVRPQAESTTAAAANWNTILSHPDESAVECIVLKEPPHARDAMLNLRHEGGAKLLEAKRDILIKTPRAARVPLAPMPKLPERGEIARLATRGGAAPRKIGRGQLVQAKLAWRPGDPFGSGTDKKKPSLRWERVIASACVTTAVGLACVWLVSRLA